MPTRISKSEKYVYFFGNGTADGDGDQRNLLGGKGANLAEMSRIGIPVPAGYTITTEVCDYYYGHEKKHPPELDSQVVSNLKKVENAMGGRFGNAGNPLLLSVRSGARVSMPGMMETVLNLGLNDEIAGGLIEKTRNERFVWDVYRRFIQTYGDVVMGVQPEEREHDPFEAAIDSVKARRGISLDTDLTSNELRELVAIFKDIVRSRAGRSFPEDPMEQLWGSVNAVFNSWNGNRAVVYRNINDIPHSWGTAVNVQAMVYGNMGDGSATGVAFTRDPSTGARKFYGEYLINAQGEDVVAGVRTPEPVAKMRRQLPGAYATLEQIYKKLEQHYREMQDIEFTVQEGRLWMLQTRTGKRTAASALKIAVDMVKEGLITREEAIARIDPAQLDHLLHPTFDPGATREVLATGLPASPGAASGRAVFTADDAETMAEDGEEVILVRLETSPEDIGGMNAARGILTARGGQTSHAAVVARGMGKCCVAGCGALSIDYNNDLFRVNGTTVNAGDWISLDGAKGEVMLGRVPTRNPKLSRDFSTVMKWADEMRKLNVRTNADTPEDTEISRKFGAEGIGLCRTEHMFFEGDRILAVREMILAADESGRRNALEKLLPIQREDFEGIFKAMKGFPVTIRLLDPPLHEFLPHEREQQREMARQMGVPLGTIRKKVDSLHEFNPMLGHRGCRLGVTYPEIYEMQARAIFEAAVNARRRRIKVIPEIMIPLVGTVKEFTELRKIVDRVAGEVMGGGRIKIDYLVGTMIEIPRAALVAGAIAESADFFSFGTNDLTQMTFGYSRDDAGKFLPAYVEQGILEHDPFLSLDQQGVGQLVAIGTEHGRSARKSLKVGICGEHGGDPESVKFCHRIGLDYVSCSPYRLPIARLAAAQAAIE